MAVDPATLEAAHQFVARSTMELTTARPSDPYTACAKDALGPGAEIFFCNEEYLDDAVQRGLVVAAMKLALWRKYPVIGRVRILSVASGAWIECRAFCSYERGKFFTQFGRDVLRKPPVHEVRV